MSGYRNILVGVDYSQHSRNAMIEAGRMALRHGSNLHVCHVLADITYEDFASCFTLTDEESIANGQEPMREFISRHLDEVATVQTHVLVGDAFAEMMRLTKETKADVLVLGTRGFSKHEHQLGMTAAKLVRHSPVPVLLVRGEQEKPFRKVVACVDFSDCSKLAIMEAARIARQDAAEFDILHVHCPPWLLPTHVMYNLTTWPTGDAKTQYSEILENEFSSFVSVVKESYPDLQFESVLVEHETPSYGILNHLRENNADLAVIGSHGHSRVRKLLLGSTTERIIHGSGCSVFVVRPKRDDD